jgi:hypothetical protein
MNRKQRVAIVLGLVLLALLGLFPPWTDSLTAPMGYHQELPSGYHFLFSTPRPFDDRHSITLDLKRLTVSWTVVLLLTGVIVVLLHSSSSAQVQQAVSAGDAVPQGSVVRKRYRLWLEVVLLGALVAVLIRVGGESLRQMERDQRVIDAEQWQAVLDMAPAAFVEQLRRDSLERKAALGRQRRAELQRRRR